MLGAPFQITKVYLVILFSLILYFIFMDVNLYFRIHTYPIERGGQYDNNSFDYNEVSWLGSNISPLADVTVKAVLLDHVNYYLFAPLVTIMDNVLRISDITYITPNMISFFHVFVAVLSAKFISRDSLTYRRLGVVLFEFRTLLDDLDGHVARARKHVKGERSEVGTAGYYIDGLCDGLGCIALLIGIFFFLKNNPPRRGYVQLPTVTDSKETHVVYKPKVTTEKVVKIVLCFSLQLFISSAAWNRYIALYQDILENTSVSLGEYLRQDAVFKSNFFFAIALLWRIVNVHNMMHGLLLAIFCDKLWEFLKIVQYFGFVILFTVIGITEVHLLDTKRFIFQNSAESSTSLK